MQNQTRQQRRAALRNADSPWKNVKPSPSVRDLNRTRYAAKKRAREEAAAKASRQLVPTLDAVS